MCVFNVHQLFRFGHSHEFHRIHISFPLNHSSQTWFIYFGGLFRNQKIINFHGSYGTYGNEETTKYLAIWILILEILSNWQKQNHYFALGHMFHLHRESIKLDCQQKQQYRLSQVDGVLRMDHGETRKPTLDKGGIAYWKVLIV